MADLPVNIRIGAIDRLSGVLKRVSNNLKGVRGAAKRASDSFHLMQMRTEKLRAGLSKVGSGMKSVGRGLLAGVTAPIAGLGVGVIKMAADFEASMNKVQALTRAPTMQFEAMRSLAQDLGASTKYSASEAADAMAFLGMAGWKTNQILEGTPAVLDLAAASGIELARAADIASNVMGAFKIPASQATRVADVLAAVTASANVDMEMLAETMKYTGPVAEKFGASLEDTAAATGLLGNLGIQGSVAGTSLKNMFLALSAPTSGAAAALENIGLKAADSKGNLKPFAVLMSEIGTKLKNLPQQAKMQFLKDFFGKIGIAGASAIADMAETGELEKFIASMNNVEGTAKRMNETINAGAKGGMKALMSAIEGLAIAIGDSGVLRVFTEITADVTKFVRELTKSNPKTMKWAFVLGMVAAAIGPVVLAMGALVSAIPFVITGITALSAATGLSVAALGWIPLAIGGAIAAGIALYKNWDAVKEGLARVWNTIKVFMDSDIAKILALLVPFIWVPLYIAKNWETIGPKLGSVIDYIKEKFSTAYNFINEKTNGFTQMPDRIKNAWSALVGFFKNLWSQIDANFFSHFKWALDPITAGLSKIKSLLPEGPSTSDIGGFLSDKFSNFLPDIGAMQTALLGPQQQPAAVTRNYVEKKEVQNKITVDFKNAPKGTVIKSDSKQNDYFNFNTGLQGVLGE